MSFFPNQLKVFPNELMHKIHIEIWDMPINFMRPTDGWCLLGQGRSPSGTCIMWITIMTTITKLRQRCEMRGPQAPLSGMGILRLTCFESKLEWNNYSSNTSIISTMS